MDHLIQQQQAFTTMASEAMNPYVGTAGNRRLENEARREAKDAIEEDRKLRKTASRGTVTGVVVAVILGGALLYFIYYSVLGKNKVIFGILVACLAIALLCALGKTVKEEGAIGLGAIEIS